MLDRDLAEIYGVSTSRLNEQVKRNKARFPEDFGFRLTDDEMKKWMSQNCDIHFGGQDGTQKASLRLR